ncbi:hypothetical protein [Chryseobacterium turcicum]|uniref:Uncharacterized protein n=1 Tax=Chryseobacterium turcicum TaxID=2898076 RepID=A0A9Q3V292_9FLAO|nr:hypothetical protein [Chryseobacterium turcicum]MCD1117504.1 hypothetical protein [Chryseobacterium turcicum]
MEYTIKLSRSQGKEIRQEAISFGIDDIGEYLLDNKMKAVIRWEESESIRSIMQEKILSHQQKSILNEFGQQYFKNISKARVFFENEEHFMIRLKVKLKENNI